MVRPTRRESSEVRLDVHGHPLHSRALSVTLVQRGDGRLDVDGSVLDLRKRGFVPVGGDLQASGVIHDMRLRAVVDPETLRLETVAAEQPTVAFEPSPATGGECCRDPIERVEALAGTILDAGFNRRLTDAIGGPRGCSHILTLGRLLGSTALWAFARDREMHGADPGRRPGERMFRRDLVVDAYEKPDGTLAFAVQQGDLHLAPASPLAPPLDRLAAYEEVCILAEVDFPTRTVTRLRIAERCRDAAATAEPAWCEHPELAACLTGLSLGPGSSPELLHRLDRSRPRTPVRDALLMLAPTLVQCLAALADRLVAAGANRSLAGLGGLPDSCYMWRRDGALARARGG